MYSADVIGTSVRRAVLIVGWQTVDVGFETG